MKPETKNLKLPAFFKPLFWSYEFSSLDPKVHEKRIVADTINYGSWKHWLWIVKFYGRNGVKKIIEEMSQTEFRKSALKLISILLGIKEIKYASRSDYIRRQKNL